MNNHTLPLLPLEVIREILLLLPVKSLLRFKCVSKSWLSLISDTQFGVSHYDLATTPTHRILMRSNDFYAQSIDRNAPFIDHGEGTLCLLRAVHLLLPPPSPPRIPDFFHFGDFRNQPHILGSCRGFVLLYYQRSDDLILWNPSIGVHKQLPHFQ
ncbi:F-box/kelch-repeat protein At3g23880-like [Vigna umbellata]|uniref:F-box/kelch-repeat protein At3g23880-like n=1 Tax=Vigna umbellata TaxID=87088 RepID=UPI001F5F7CF1|nr:F-box/kelch-repeat protein At3g23880-like [Vigna umbellata]